MKNILCTLILLLLPFLVNAKTFENDLFTFTYPNNFEEAQIYNTKIIRLKLVSDNAMIKISHWEKGLSKDFDAWHNEIYNIYKNGFPSSECILIEKVEILAADNKHRALKIYSNDIYGIGSISFLIIYNGDIYTFNYCLPHKITKNTSSYLPEKLLSGLKFKQKEKGQYPFTSIEEFEDFYISTIKSASKSLPIQVDEATTLYSVLCINKTILLKYSVKSEFVPYMDGSWCNDFKEKTIVNMLASVPTIAPILAEYFAKSSLNVVYTFYDEEGNLIKTINITPKDFEL